MSENDAGGLHRRLTLNSASNLARYVLSMAIAFFLTPFVVRTLGDSLYGFWVLLLSFIGYASILELGVQPAVVKLVGQYRAVENRAKLQELITAAALFFGAVSALGAVFCLTLLPGILESAVTELHDLPHVRWLYLLIAVETVVMYFNYLFTGILFGWQRYHLRNLIDAAGWALNTALIVAFLARGGLVALVAAKLAMDVFVLVASALAARRLSEAIRFRVDLVRRESFRELIGFGGKLFVSATTSRIAIHTQPIVITWALNAAATAFYAIPLRLVDYARQITWALSAGFMPAFSELESRSERDLLRSVYLDYTRYLFVGTLPILVLLAAYGAPFIGLWIGEEYARRGALALYFLVGSVFVESFQPLLWRFFIGVGYLDVLVKVSATVSLLTVLLSVGLVRPLGIGGVALSVLFGSTVSHLVFARHSCRYLEIGIGDFLRRVHLRPLLAAAVMATVAALAGNLVGVDSYLRLLTASALSLAAYLAIVMGLVLRPTERAALRARLARNPSA